MIANIIVLILEVLYYSLFMKFTRGKEKFLNREVEDVWLVK